jgi:glycosyltransferase involved in cell wall biosynthesis
MPVARFLPTGARVSRSPSERVSVVHVLALTGIGGIDRVVRMLAVGQRRRGHRVLVAALVNDAHTRAEWVDGLRTAGVDVELLVAGRRRYATEWRLVSSLLWSRRSSIVHTHGYHADVVAGLAARRLGLPAATTVHGFIGGDWKNRLYERLQYRVFRGFDAVIAVSRSMADEIRRSGVSSDRVHTVMNAFQADRVPLARAEARRVLGIPEGEFRVGWVGRLSHEKGPDLAIRAIAASTSADVQLSLVGDGAERRRLQSLAERIGVGERITWHGAVPDAAALSAAFDMLMLSSRTEGTPIVLYEAMAAGTPVVAARVGGIPDVVSSTEAILVPPGDPRALAGAIAAVRGDPAGAAARAAAAARRVTRDFAVDPWLARVDDVYAVVQERRAGSERR